MPGKEDAVNARNVGTLGEYTTVNEHGELSAAERVEQGCAMVRARAAVDTTRIDTLGPERRLTAV